jgi:hypothetical protein
MLSAEVTLLIHLQATAAELQRQEAEQQARQTAELEKEKNRIRRIQVSHKLLLK